MKKMTALLLVFAMLTSLFPAVAADEMSAKPTVEEILSEYHRNAFEPKVNGDTEASSTWSHRSGNARTLEQETVDTLNNAGYEAYIVTTDNYETLEAELKTDFDAMGLDPNGEYIVVISGADQAETNSTGGYTTFGLQPGQDEAPDGGGGTFFEYIHDGTKYYMRYLTIAPTTGNGMTRESVYYVQPDMFLQNTFSEILNTSLVTIAETTVEEAYDVALPIGLTLSILDDWFSDENFRELEPGTVTILSDSSWTCNLIQIWTASTSCWDTAQCSEYVVSSAQLTALKDDRYAQMPVRQYSEQFSNTRYSPKYHNESQRITEAIDHYDRVHSSISLDYIYSISFFFKSEDEEILWDADGTPLFTHNRSFSIPSHSFD